MSENNETTSRTDSYRRDRRRKRIQNVKTGGHLAMYIGAAGLMMPQIQKSRENANGIMKLCSLGAGAILSVGLGQIASRLFDSTVDKAVNFWDDVKPNGPNEKTQKEAEDNG